MPGSTPGRDERARRAGGGYPATERMRPENVDTHRPVWAEVDLAAVHANVQALRALVAPAAVCAVVKAEGYGHGAVEVGRAALAAGADWLAVALVEEGVQLRDAGIDAPILVLSEPVADAAETVVARHLTPVVYTAVGHRRARQGGRDPIRRRATRGASQDRHRYASRRVRSGVRARPGNARHRAGRARAGGRVHSSCGGRRAVEPLHGRADRLVRSGARVVARARYLAGHRPRVQHRRRDHHPGRALRHGSGRDWCVRHCSRARTRDRAPAHACSQCEGARLVRASHRGRGARLVRIALRDRTRHAARDRADRLCRRRAARALASWGRGVDRWSTVPDRGNDHDGSIDGRYRRRSGRSR